MSDIIRMGLTRLSQGEVLAQPEAYALMDAIMRGEASAVQIAGILTALAVRGETVDELTGFAEAMRRHARSVTVSARPLIDTCGTGGDRSMTFNVSTIAGLVVAGAGVRVGKHGNRSATSKSGSADLLEALGVNIHYDPQAVARQIETVGFGFLFAQDVHTSMRHAAPARRELGIRTAFNVLGPLTNPLRPEYQLMGVFSGAWVERVATVLARLGTRRAMVVHGAGGLDEVSLAGETVYGLVDHGTVQLGVLTPDDLGLPQYPAAEFLGGDPQTNAEICWAVLNDEAKPAARDFVLANAGVALYVAQAAASPKEGVALARESIRRGRARAVLEQLREGAHVS